MLDVLIRGGWVADGTGNPLYKADVAIEGDRVVDVRPLPGAQATHVVAAQGKIVCPGFVDAHSHSDFSIHANPTAESTIRQGVTTEIVGQCGLASWPLTPASREAVTARLRMYAYEGPVEWDSFEDYLGAIAAMGTSCNLAFFVGHNALRTAAGVVGPAVSEEQYRLMESYLHQALAAGALGLSTGLEFEPGRQATTAEIMRLAKVVAEHKGMHASHIRNRDEGLEAAIEEFLAIVRRAGIKGQVSHLNVRENTGAAPGAWQKAVAMLERARRDGVEVLTDTTPLREGIGQMQGILPPWVLAEGSAQAATLLRDPAVRRRLRGECDRYWRFIHRGDWQRARLQSSTEFPELCGKTFPEIAENMGQDPWDCYFDILAAAGAKMDSLFLVAELFGEEHSAAMVGHPLFILTTDTFTSRIDGPLSQTSRHPLNYMGMVHYLTHHVRRQGTLRLEEAIRKMTSMPATQHGLHDRGLLRPGHKADVVVFDFDALADVATSEQPLAYARGVEHVFVNGVAVVAGGEHTGARPGRNLLRG
ncbi:MAG: amidohydrolase family protein [Chloroflexi bacterium]|nr:amidohydrolase family protein [Chloroflexota bacterium]